MSVARKITIHVPEELLSKAQRSTGQGITETVRRGLKLVAAGAAYEKARRLRVLKRAGLDTLGKKRA